MMSKTPPCDEYTGESLPHGGEYTGEFRLPGGEYYAVNKGAREHGRKDNFPLAAVICK
jgi:hypothetical protein